ncbi:MAG TPA: hypothetical protein VLD67_19825 [Vicinamibacterales bacterium]|nr:hypothetical protein [Gemmatimonadaceae bacterium]HSC29536.1 hypothetical protein [Vicinamibacterales bacterium]
MAQYLANLSLHTDEAAIALNLRDRSLAGLLSAPLDYAQMAPPGWLALQWGVLRGLGGSEYALRLVPLVASLTSLVLLAALGRRVSSGLGPALAVAWLAASWDFLFYGTQLKQYASDTATALALLLIALRALHPESRLGWRLGIGSGLLILFSLTAAFVAAALGAVLIADALVVRSRARARRLVPLVIPWAVAAALVAGWTLLLTPAPLAAYMNRFWEYTYAPWPLSPLESVQWVWQTIRRWVLAPISSDWQRHLPKVYALLLFVGAVALARRRPRPAVLLAAPVAFAVGLTMAHRYPIGGRVTLYLLPIILLAMAHGAEQGLRLLRGRAPAWVAVAALIALLLPAGRAIAAASPPQWFDNARPLVRAVAAVIRPEDVLYVHHSVAKPFDWYWPGAQPMAGRLIRGRCYNGDPRPYFRELDALRGRPRVWMLSTDPTWNAYAEVAAYEQAVGLVRDSVVTSDAPRQRDGGRQVAYLRDFSDASALAAVRADTITLPPNRFVDWIGWTCFGSERQPVLHPSLWR